VDLGHEWVWFFVVEGLLKFVYRKGGEVERFTVSQP
jgi:hypothetical protein